MFDYLGKDIKVHNSLTKYLAQMRKIEGKSSDEEVVRLFNEWPENYLCDTLNLTAWALSYIKEKTCTNWNLFTEACKIDGNV